MFDNIGGKIKALAKVVCFLGIAGSVIAGLVAMAQAGEVSKYSDDVATATAFSGFLIMVIGSLLSWIGSFFTYGFGELIEKATEIEKNTRGETQSTGVLYTENESDKATGYMPDIQKPVDTWICPRCGKENSTTVQTCECGGELSILL